MSQAPLREPETNEQSSNEIVLDRSQSITRFWDGVKRFVRTQPLGVASLALILIFTLAAIFADVLAPHDPVHQYRQNFLAAPSGEFLMGTDDMGRDVFSRILYGARISLYVGLATVTLSILLGIIFGAVSGYFGGWVDMIIQRIMDGILAIPALVLAIFIAALLGPAINNVVLALVIIETPRFARIVRGEMLRIRETNYVEAAQALGAHPLRIILRHGIPNMVAPIIVIASLAFGQSIIAEASLSFLGIGTPPPNPSWGLMLSDATRYMENAPWLMLFPGIALSLAVLAFNLLGDALRDFLDPKLPS